MTAPLMTRVLSADAAATADAVRCLAAGGLVAFPTETVYGLGADATNGQAVARLYEAKGRPAFNPLIAHVVDLEAAQALARFNADAARLAERFWPGPLTLVLPKAAGCPVAELATAGLDSIAVRVPNHAVAQKILGGFGKPVVAPSANRSGHVSPTTAAHVLADLRGRIDLIVDGGSTPVGVESTIVACLGRTGAAAPRRRAARGDRAGAGTAACASAGRRCGSGRRTARARHAGLALCAAHAAAARRQRRRSRRSFACLRSEACCGLPNARRACSTFRSAAISSRRRPICSRICARSTAHGAKAIAVMPVPHEGLGEAINDRLSAGSRAAMNDTLVLR